MALQMGALRSALMEAGASGEKASEAAEKITGYERRFAKVESDLTMVKWMLSLLMASVTLLVLKAFI